MHVVIEVLDRDVAELIGDAIEPECRLRFYRSVMRAGGGKLFGPDSFDRAIVMGPSPMDVYAAAKELLEHWPAKYDLIGERYRKEPRPLRLHVRERMTFYDTLPDRDERQEMLELLKEWAPGTEKFQQALTRWWAVRQRWDRAGQESSEA